MRQHLHDQHDCGQHNPQDWHSCPECFTLLVSIPCHLAYNICWLGLRMLSKSAATSNLVGLGTLRRLQVPAEATNKTAKSAAASMPEGFKPRHLYKVGTKKMLSYYFNAKA